MVTKLKKWKSSTGFLAFAVSVSLLISGGMGLGYEMVNYGTLSGGIKAVNCKDYQDSSSFRDYMSGWLEDFLAMACGDFVCDYGYDYDYDGSIYYDTAETVVEEGAIEDGSYTGADHTEKEKKEAADRYHNYIKSDKNLLYRIVYDGRELYTNMEGIDWNNDADALPEGYNFYLHFDGTEVTVRKDGKELEIYGDGIYREGEDWYVPGFKNFTGKDKWKKADIIMLASKEPILYAANSYSNDGTYWGGTYYSQNRLYYLNQSIQEERRRIRGSIAGIVAGVILFVLYLYLRKDKQEVDRKLAKLTGKIWFEGKVLLFLILTVLPGMTMGDSSRTGITELTTAYVSDFGMVYEDAAAEYISELGSYLLIDLMSHPTEVLLIFWMFYLFLNDLSKNRSSYRHGLTGKFVHILNSKNMNLPVSKKIIKRPFGIYVLTLVQLLFFLLWIILLLVPGYRIWQVDTGGILLLSAGAAITVLLIFAEYFYQKENRQLAVDLERMAERISSIRDGNYESKEDFTTDDPDIRHMASELEEIRQGMETAVEERTRSERMKVELVANVSHDIKTPLTAIISYIQLLKQEENLPEYVMDYIRILDEKSDRLKNMVQDVFSVSKAASGQLDVELKEIDFGKLLYQTLADMEEQIKKSPVIIRTDIPQEPVMVSADGQRMYRVFQNLIGNALKYSLEGSRVYITLKEEKKLAVASIKNTSSQELNPETDFAERFTRGDQSRTDGGSGLGLSIAKSFTEACGGSFRLEIIADLFVVTVALPLEFDME